MDQSTAEIRRINWMNTIAQCQKRSANTTVKQWLADHDVGEKAYYYWLRKIRRETYEQIKASNVTQSTEVSFAEVHLPTNETKSTMIDSYSADIEPPAAVIKGKGLTIEISNSISENLLARLLQEVCHA